MSEIRTPKWIPVISHIWGCTDTIRETNWRINRQWIDLTNLFEQTDLICWIRRSNFRNVYLPWVKVLFTPVWLTGYLLLGNVLKIFAISIRQFLNYRKIEEAIKYSFSTVALVIISQKLRSKGNFIAICNKFTLFLNAVALWIIFRESGRWSIYDIGDDVQMTWLIFNCQQSLNIISSETKIYRIGLNCSY